MMNLFRHNHVGASVQNGFLRMQTAWVTTPAGEKLFDKILIANRGEIACRVIKTCKKLGIKTVAVYSDADRNSLFVRQADEAVNVGPPPTRLSYLNTEAILDAVRKTGAQAVHPGYGFLSENHHFAKALEDINVSFIGPDSHAVIAMGDKINSKKIAIEAGVSTIPGYLADVQDEEEVLKIANKIGYPVMVKASAGGGGKGMRVAYNDEEARVGYRLSREEARSSFGDDRMFIEKFIEDPRHIEFQLLGDKHGNYVYLNERECSIQRRNQKVFEEAPSVFLTPDVRKKMGEQAVMMARQIKYSSAGTCEFLVDKHRNFYFLEVNTRLQVEHPITEWITGVDLVEQMIRVAAGLPLNFSQKDVGINGWACESRVCAENPLKNFLPSVGRLSKYREPLHIPNVRIDSGIVEGSEISIYYDSMISKLITHGKDRNEALATMKKALDSYVIRGVTHNVNFLRTLIEHPRFVRGELTTKFIPEEFPQGYLGHPLLENQKKALQAGAAMIHLDILRNSRNGSDQLPLAEYTLPEKLMVRINGGEWQPIDLKAQDGEATMQLQGFKEPVKIKSHWTVGDLLTPITVDGEDFVLQVLNKRPHKYVIQHVGTAYTVEVATPREAELLDLMPPEKKVDTSKVVLAPMPGSVFSVKVKEGDVVFEGQEVCVIEAMKMQNMLHAGCSGRVKAVHIKEKQTVAADEVLVEFEPHKVEKKI